MSAKLVKSASEIRALPKTVAICEHCDIYLVYKAENAPYPSVAQRMFGRNVGSQIDVGCSSHLTPVVSDFVSRLVRIKTELLGGLNKSSRRFLKAILASDNDESSVDEDSESSEHSISEHDSDFAFDQTARARMMQRVQRTANTCKGCARFAAIMTRSIWLLDKTTTVCLEYPPEIRAAPGDDDFYSVVVLKHMFMPICVAGIVPGGNDTLTALALGRLDVAPFPTRASDIHHDLYFNLKRSQIAAAASSTATATATTATTSKTTKSNKTMSANVGWKTALIYKDVGDLETARKAADEIMDLWYPKDREAARGGDVVETTVGDGAKKKTMLWVPDLMENYGNLTSLISFKYKDVIGSQPNQTHLYTIQ